MEISYNKLWNILEERKLNRTELVHIAGISTNAMAKLGKNEDVRLRVLIKISCALDKKIDDIVDYEMNDR